MNRKQSVFALFFAALVVAGMVTAALLVAPPTELKVYRALLHELEATSTDAVLMSRPTQCNAGSFAPNDDLNKKFGGSETFRMSLYQSFLAANDGEATPIQIESLTDLIAVINYDASKSYRNSPGLLRPLNRRIVTLSRVGFDSSRSEALLCIESHAGSLYHLKYGQDGWKLVGDFSTWVS